MWGNFTPHFVEGSEFMIFILIPVILIIAVIAKNIVVVPQAHAYVVERLGVYYATLEPGLHVTMPILDRIVARISLKEQVLDFPPQSLITYDNVSMSVDSVVYARVFDPKKYTYGVENPIVGLQNLTATTLRSVIGEMDLDATLSSREQINSKMRGILDEATDEWGLQVTRVEVKNIKPPREIEEVMTKQMRAERERRQTVLEAQAHQESVVARAKGDKEAKIMAAEAERDSKIAMAQGQAEALLRIYEAEAMGLQKLLDAGLDPEIMVRLKSIDAMKDIADGQATKIFVPTDIAAGLSAIGAAGDVFKQNTEYSNISRETFREQKRQELEDEILEADDCLRDDVTEQTIHAARSSADYYTDR